MTTKSLRPLCVFCLCLLAFALAAETRAQSAPQLTSDLLSEFKWRLIGPSSPAGRVWQVVGDENDPKTFYVCTAGGGLWKSTDNGTTLVAVFDNQTSASTGAVAIAQLEFEHCLGRNRRTGKHACKFVGRRRLQIRQRGQNMDAHGPAGEPAD